jgi:hypothetical protein
VEAGDARGRLADALPQCLGGQDLHLIPEAEDPARDFVEAIDLQVEVHRPVVAGHQALAAVPPPVVDLGGDAGREPQPDLVALAAAVDAPGVPQDPLQAEAGRDRVRVIGHDGPLNASDRKNPHLAMRRRPTDQVPELAARDEPENAQFRRLRGLSGGVRVPHAELPAEHQRVQDRVEEELAVGGG